MKWLENRGVGGQGISEWGKHYFSEANLFIEGSDVLRQIKKLFNKGRIVSRMDGLTRASWKAVDRLKME